MCKIVHVFVILLISAQSGTAQSGPGIGFVEFVTQRLNRSGGNDNAVRINASIDKVCDIEKSALARRVFVEYGAMFAAADSIRLPPNCVFPDDESVRRFRIGLETKVVRVRESYVVLQMAAADGLEKALGEAQRINVTISAFDGSIAGGRDFEETVRLWRSRFEPALRYWTREGKIPAAEGTMLRISTLEEQISRVIEWEARGLWFGTGRMGSIFSSTAPPGTSQHLSLIAFDVAPPVTPAKRALMNSHGWYQTVKGDPSHFTYLGLPEAELPQRGLQAVLNNGTQYWVPRISSSSSVNP